MLVYLYDGSFEGLLTCIYESYYKRKPDHIYVDHLYLPHLLHEIEYVVTDNEKANTVGKAIINKLSELYFHKILNAFYSEDAEAGIKIFNALYHGFKYGHDVIMNEIHPSIAPVVELSRSVGRETHLLVGLVRFQKLKGGIYYCQFSPTYNQVALLAEHFANRFADQVWVIHDLGRNIAVFYDKKSWYVNEFYGLDQYELDDEELLYQSLWKTFHKHIAIKERINPTLQRSFMPKKYWKYLIEMN